jgi:hypothetical protein
VLAWTIAPALTAATHPVAAVASACKVSLLHGQHYFFLMMRKEGKFYFTCFY